MTVSIKEVLVHSVHERSRLHTANGINAITPELLSIVPTRMLVSQFREGWKLESSISLKEEDTRFRFQHIWTDQQEPNH